MSVYSAYGLAGEAEEISLGQYSMAPDFLLSLTSFPELDSLPSKMPVGEQNSSKSDTNIPTAHDTSHQPAKEKYPFWSAQLWNLDSSTLQDPGWRLRFDIWLNASSRCTSSSCPIKSPHNQGRYLHKGKLNWEMDGPFGSSNPTSEVWGAQAKIESGENTEEDRNIVEAFKKLHVGKGDFGPI